LLDAKSEISSMRNDLESLSSSLAVELSASASSPLNVIKWKESISVMPLDIAEALLEGGILSNEMKLR
jgi:hypothetical protein